GEPIEVLHQRMTGIELERRLRLRNLLARGREDPPHADAEIVLPEHQARRGFGEARADAHFQHPVADRILHPLEQALALLQLRLAALTVGFALERPELEIAARG